MLQITVKEGVVIFRGSVPNAALKHIVQQVAEHTTGVVAIRNELAFPYPK